MSCNWYIVAVGTFPTVNWVIKMIVSRAAPRGADWKELNWERKPEKYLKQFFKSRVKSFFHIVRSPTVGSNGARTKKNKWWEEIVYVYAIHWPGARESKAKRKEWERKKLETITCRMTRGSPVCVHVVTDAVIYLFNVAWCSADAPFSLMMQQNNYKERLLRAV